MTAPDGRYHALVVGGTGMLSGVSLWLAEQGHTVTVVARRRERLDALVRAAQGCEGRIRPLAVDYRADTKLRRGLEAAISACGPLAIAVCWIHSTAPRAVRTVARVASRSSDALRLIHVRASAVDDPSRTGAELTAWMPRLPLSYEVVIPGFARENGASRWLTDREIATGVIRAIQEPAATTVVGEIRPWCERP